MEILNTESTMDMEEINVTTTELLLNIQKQNINWEKTGLDF